MVRGECPPLFGPALSNFITAIVFASFHVQITYSPVLAFFLAIALVLGLVLGYLERIPGCLKVVTLSETKGLCLSQPEISRDGRDVATSLRSE
jgi:hypothetical protein